MIGEKQREDMRDFLVKAYADGVLPEDGLEARLKELEALADSAALVAMVERVKALYAARPPLAAEYAASPAEGAASPAEYAASPAEGAANPAEGAAAPVPAGPAPEPPAAVEGVEAGPPAQLVRGVGMNSKRRGRWFTSERIRIELDRSNLVLDFSELVAFPGIFMELSLDLRGSNVSLIFPKGTMISEDLDNSGSNVHVTHRGDNLYRLAVHLSGRVEGTNLRAKTRALY